MDYSKWGRYRLRLSKADIKENLDFISELLKMAFTETTGMVTLSMTSCCIVADKVLWMFKYLKAALSR
jgi:hypothetical protein